jgi:hypothetical protein
MPADSSRVAEYLTHVRANNVSRDAIVSRIFTARAPRAVGQDWGQLQGFPRIETADLRQVLTSSLASGGAGFAISISHDHYQTIAGGVQNCVGLEEKAFRQNRWTFLHLCPSRPLPVLAADLPAAELEVLASVDGTTLGILPIAAVIEVLAGLTTQAEQCWVIIHQLLGHSPELVRALISAAHATRVYFWTHDLFAHCPSIHLLRNNATFCGGPPVSSSACGICHAGAERAAHVERMRRFFTSVRPTLLSPSQTILDMWRILNDFAHEAPHVVPPCGFHPDPETSGEETSAPLRIGFLGFHEFHKGWDVFESLALWFAADPRYRFFRLGIPGDSVPGVEHYKVEVTPENRMAMADAVAACRLDVVINWSRCYESFSFTAIEALAGGAFVVARAGSGNVVPLIRSIDPARGVQVATDVELQALFVTGQIAELARQAPRKTGRLAMGIGAAALIPGHAA